MDNPYYPQKFILTNCPKKISLGKNIKVYKVPLRGSWKTYLQLQKHYRPVQPFPLSRLIWNYKYLILLGLLARGAVMNFPEFKDTLKKVFFDTRNSSESSTSQSSTSQSSNSANIPELKSLLNIFFNSDLDTLKKYFINFLLTDAAFSAGSFLLGHFMLRCSDNKNFLNPLFLKTNSDLFDSYHKSQADYALKFIHQKISKHALQQDAKLIIFQIPEFIYAYITTSLFVYYPSYSLDEEKTQEEEKHLKLS